MNPTIPNSITAVPTRSRVSQVDCARGRSAQAGGDEQGAKHKRKKRFRQTKSAIGGNGGVKRTPGDLTQKRHININAGDKKKCIGDGAKRAQGDRRRSCAPRERRSSADNRRDRSPAAESTGAAIRAALFRFRPSARKKRPKLNGAAYLTTCASGASANCLALA